MACVIWRISGVEVCLPGVQDIQQKFTDALFLLHYKSIMGKTIDSVTYYTDKGMITFDVPDVKVQTTTGIKATVADIMNTDSSAAVTLTRLCRQTSRHSIL